MGKEPLILGIDPDSKSTAWAVATIHKVLAVGVVRGPGDVVTMLRNTGLALDSICRRGAPEIAVVESQFEGQSPFADILKVAQIAGGMIGQITALHPPTRCSLVLPATWKGQQPKEVNQARTFTHYAMLYEKAAGYCVPSGCAVASQIDGIGRLNRGDWKHVADALGLALFGAKLLPSLRPA